MFSTTPEKIKKELMDIFENNYPFYLTQVATLHTDDPVIMEDFKEIFYADATRVKEINKWPSLAVTSGDVISIQRAEQGRSIFWQTQIYLRFFLRHANQEILEKTIDRHTEATLLMFEDDPYRSINHKVDSFEFLRAEKTDSIMPLGSTIYVRGLEIQWEARHR